MRAEGAQWKSLAERFHVTPRAIVSALTYVPKGIAHRQPNRILKAQKNMSGYACVMLSENGAVRQIRIHRAVAAAFLPLAPSSRHEINHKDGNKMNARADNLEWATRSENMLHSFEKLDGKTVTQKGEDSHFAKLSEDQAQLIIGAYAAGQKVSRIAIALGVNYHCVWNIAKGRTWTHLRPH